MDEHRLTTALDDCRAEVRDVRQLLFHTIEGINAFRLLTTEQWTKLFAALDMIQGETTYHAGLLHKPDGGRIPLVNQVQTLSDRHITSDRHIQDLQSKFGDLATTQRDCATRLTTVEGALAATRTRRALWQEKLWFPVLVTLGLLLAKELWTLIVKP